MRMRRQEAINRLEALGFEKTERKNWIVYTRGEIEVSIVRAAARDKGGDMFEVMQAIKKVEAELKAKQKAAPAPEIQIMRDRALSDLTREERQFLNDEIRAGTATPEISEVLQLNPMLIDNLRFKYKQRQPEPEIEEEEKEEPMQTQTAPKPAPTILSPSAIEQTLPLEHVTKTAMVITEEAIIITHTIPKKLMTKKLLAHLLD